MSMLYGMGVNPNFANKREDSTLQDRQCFSPRTNHVVDAEMDKPILLEFFPAWYQRGDPDDLVFAVLYGFVALATIWLLEYICELILFSTAKGILLSDAAAHIALNNSNWLDIARWVWTMDKNSRLCRRAFMALIFRCILVAIDLGILVQAVPHEINVHENEVGGTELSFSPNAVHVQAADPRVIIPLCKADFVRYKGFNPTASKTICLVQLPNKSFNSEDNSSVATFHFNSSHGKIHIQSTRSHNQYAIRHFLRLIGGAKGDGSDLFTGSARDMLEQAVQAAQIAAGIPLMKSWSCVPRRTNNLTAVLNCTTAPQGDLTFKFYGSVIVELYRRVGTVKIDAKGTVYTDVGGELRKKLNNEGRGPRLGTITRPRLCIFPALILLFCIGVIALVIRVFTGSQDFAWKLWLFLSLSAGMSKKNTPFNTECTEIDVMDEVMWRDEVDGQTFDGSK